MRDARLAWLVIVGSVAVSSCGGEPFRAPTAPEPPVALGPDGRVTAQNSPPSAVFQTTPTASPANPGDVFFNPEVDGRIEGKSPLDVTFNMCPSRDPDPGDELKFTYDFDGDGVVDSRGTCRATHTYLADDLEPSRDFCQLPENPAEVCVSDRQPFDGHTICRQYVVCARGPLQGGGTFTFSQNTPTPIPPSGTAGTTTQTLPVSGVGGLIADVDLAVHLTHTFDGDLEISLDSPLGTSVLLVDNRGGSGNDYGTSCAAKTLFDDEAATPITSGTPPFSGAFIPENPLSAFDGEDANGTWTLTINDTIGGDSGTLQCWDVILTTQ